jgi:uncharacterized protein (TIGR03086 family)
MTAAHPLSIVARGNREIVITRAFSAPRSLVWEAFTRPELLRRWFGVFDQYTMAVCEIDLRVGGTYRYVWTGPNDFRLGMGGVFREIVPPERMVYTESFEESWYAGEALNTALFSEQAGRTTVTISSLYDSQEGRDMALASGMEKGIEAGFDGLDRVLAALQARATVAGRYELRANRFEQYVAGVRADQWDNPTPCVKWTARDLVQHIVEMHAVTLYSIGRALSPAPSVSDDPLAAFKAARADVEAALADPQLAQQTGATPTGPQTFEQHVDRVPSIDMLMHGWDLARATDQDDTMDPDDVQASWAGLASMPPDFVQQLRTPGAFGPGVEVFGPEVPVPADAPLQDRLLGFVGRDPDWRPS